MEFKFDSEPVERFRYRSDDALRAVSVNAIKDARIKEIKTEILNSEQLKVSSCLIPRLTLKIIHST